MLSGTTRSLPPCQPAPSSTSTAWAPGATVRAISARWTFIASVSAKGSTRRGADAALPGRPRRRCRPIRSGCRARRARAGAALRPDPGQRALLADAGLVLEPDLERLAAGRLGKRLRYRLRRSFFKSLLGASVGLRVARAHRQPAIAERRQLLAHRALVQRHPERRLDPPLRDPCAASAPPRRPSGRGPPPPSAANSAICAGRQPPRPRPARAGSPARPAPRHCSDAPSPAASGDPSRRSPPRSVRSAPSSTSAIASIRRAARAVLRPPRRRAQLRRRHVPPRDRDRSSPSPASSCLAQQ